MNTTNIYQKLKVKHSKYYKCCPLSINVNKYHAFGFSIMRDLTVVIVIVTKQMGMEKVCISLKSGNIGLNFFRRFLLSILPFLPL